VKVWREDGSKLVGRGSLGSLGKGLCENIGVAVRPHLVNERAVMQQ
jgi:hypothetical protein